MIGQLVTGDFSDNTMIFKMDGDITLQPGKYKIELLSECPLENIVCDYFGITYEQLHSKSREETFARARQILMYYDIVHLNKKGSIAKLRFNKDHSTVSSSVATIEKIISIDKKFKKQFDSIVSRLNEVA